MLQHLKKSSSKVDARHFTAWHPNFVDASRLPDVKVVRTSFFVNSAAIIITSLFLIFVGKREYNVSLVNSETESVENQISSVKAESSRLINEFNKFKNEEKKLIRVIDLTSNSFSFPDFMIHLGAKLPDKVTISEVNRRGPGQMLSLKAVVKGLSAESGESASNYIKQLQSDEYIKSYFTDVKLLSIERDVTRGNLNLNVSMMAVTPKK